MWTGNDYKINIILIRHGETLSNKFKRYMSYTDEELSIDGRKSLAEMYEGNNIKAEKVYISPMRRCRQTADIIFNRDDFCEMPELIEMNFGIFEGKNYEDLSDNLDYRKWVESGCEETIPQGEKKSDFADRIERGVNKILLDSKDYSDIAIVCHGGTIMAIKERFGKLNFYDNMLKNGQNISCQAVYNIDGDGNVKISSFGLVDRDNN